MAAITNHPQRSEVTAPLSSPFGVPVAKRAIWAQAVQEMQRAGGRDGPGLRPAVVAVVATLGEWAGNPHPRRVAPGVVSCWYSELETATGFRRRSVADAMRWLRAVGLLVGAPEPADPTNDWYRERGTYHLAVPHVLRRLLARLAHPFRDRSPRPNEGHPEDRPRAVTTTRELSRDERRHPPPVDNAQEWPRAPRPPLPADYIEARQRSAAKNGGTRRWKRG